MTKSQFSLAFLPYFLHYLFTSPGVAQVKVVLNCFHITGVVSNTYSSSHTHSIVMQGHMSTQAPYLLTLMVCYHYCISLTWLFLLVMSLTLTDRFLYVIRHPSLSRLTSHWSFLEWCQNFKLFLFLIETFKQSGFWFCLFMNSWTKYRKHRKCKSEY